MKESDLYEPLKMYFESQRYIIYNEVQETNGMKRADMVLTKENELIVIEMKTSLTFNLIDQARYWTQVANYVYIAVPYSKTERSQTAYDVLKMFGIGIIEIDIEKNKVISIISGRKREDSLLNKSKLSFLTEEHQTWSKAGSPSSSKYVTGYSLLMNDVYKALREASKLGDERAGWLNLQDLENYINENSREHVKKYYPDIKKGLYQSLIKFEDGDIYSVVLKGRRYFKIMDESTKFLNMEGE